MHNYTNHQFKIVEHRRQVASLLAQSMTETEIAEQLNVDQSTISRDVKVLKEMSRNQNSCSILSLIHRMATVYWL